MAAIAATGISVGLAGLAGGPAHAAARPAGRQYSTPGGLTGVAATSAANAWAVGYAGRLFGSKVLLLHWNGAKWSRITGPAVLTGAGALTGITVVSAKDAWAVGYYRNAGHDQTLVLHWNGTAWQRVSSPDVSDTGNDLYAVAATSAGAWLVGATGGSRALALRCTAQGCK